MSNRNYGLIKGVIVEGRQGSHPGSHFQIHVRAGEEHFRLSVNVRSRQTPKELLYRISDDYQHPVLDDLELQQVGFTGVATRPGGIALDYVRGNFVERSAMRPIPYSLPGANNDLNDRLELIVARAIAEPGAIIYAYGDRWGPEPDADDAFGFSPGSGMHSIHMNQGSVDYWLGERHFVPDNGVWQDGALFIHFAAEQRWVALFLAFQSQSWETDNVTGAPMAVTSREEPRHRVSATPARVAKGSIRILAAMIDPIGQGPESEWVLLLNSSPDAIDLSGWRIVDRSNNATTLQGVLAPGETRKVALDDDTQLGNLGGAISLLDRDGRNIHGVAYSKGQVKAEGWTVVF